jgi:hypothetical protein
VGLREELYAESGKLMKVSNATAVKRIGDRWYATEATMENKLKKGSKTRLIIDEIEFDVNIPQATFSRQALGK